MKKEIAEILMSALKKDGVELRKEDIESKIEIPPSMQMGDYAFPCFFLAEKIKQAPTKIALKIKENISSKEFNVQVSGAYVNFFIDKKVFAEKIIKDILKKKKNFGRKNIGKGKKFIIEHTSINPNASPHVGRARNAIIGDSLVKIFSFLEFKSETHYYVNDISKQIAMLFLVDADKLKFKDMLKKYIEVSKKIATSKSLEKKVFEILGKFEQGDKVITKKINKIVKTCVDGQKKILLKLGIKYDFFDYESSYLTNSKKILEELKKTRKLFKDKDGRFYLDQQGTSVENKMKSPVFVLTRSDGTGLYPLRDIAYTIYKMKSSKNNLIVLGEDQKLYFQQLKEALKIIGFDSPVVVHYSFILLMEKGKAKRMSTRKGDVVLLEDFLDMAVKKAKKEIEKRNTKGDPEKIGVGAVKYAILKNNNNKLIHFNLDDALNFEGDTGPYIQYSYARASSILRKAKAKGNLEIHELETKEFELIKKLSEFPEIVLSAYKNLNPSLIANYAYSLSQIFNEFYHLCPVIGSKQESFRISLIKSFTFVLKNALGLLGIETMEEM